ncbi:MAG: hypothetical protein EOP08_11685, partial [Proteobacteria bacterium]
MSPMAGRPPKQKKRSLALTIPLWIGKVLGTLVLFLVAVVAAVLIHIDHPLTRKVAQTQVNGLLASLFMGTIEITQLDHIRLVGVSGVSVSLKDPEGVEVLAAENVSGRVDVGTLLAGLPGSIRLGLRGVEVEKVRALIEQNADGELRIANVFLPRDPTPPTNEPSTFHLVLEEGLLEDVHVVNRIGMPVDADLRHVGASVQVHPERVTVMVDHGGIRTHGVPGAAEGAPGADLDGVLAATLSLPSASGQSVGLHAGLQGTATLSTFATLTLGESIGVSAVARAARIDLAELVPDGPKSN